MKGSRDSTKAGAAAVELRVCGASFAQIADTLALSSAVEALRLVETELASRLTDSSVEVQRAEASERLQTLLAAVMSKALDEDHPEHLPAARVALAIIDRHIRLHGLDRPSEVIVHTPTTQELETWVSAVVAARDPDVIEADIIGGNNGRALPPGS